MKNKPKDQSAILERFDEIYVWLDARNTFRPEVTPKRIKKFIAKELSLAEQRGREETIDNILIWMEAHDRQDKSFDTDNLIEYLRKGGVYERSNKI